LQCIQKYTKKQSEFSTDYASSTIQRKENINLAFSKINGTVLNSGEEFSFNAVVGERTAENGFKEAKVILAGEYENGIGGGVCQASTTLYNAVIRAGLDVMEVNPHSMPASYVPLSLDAMVSWGYSDLKFVNNTDGPLFIKTLTDGSKLTATIYGNTLKENQKAVPRAELIKTLPHEGDKVVADIEGKYADKIMFKGEYVRETSPKEGYESRAYIDFYENGILVNSKEIRHDIYKPKQGVVYEGAEILPEGMTLPPNNVSIIAPQT
jgi:vancomycin resistance protein YoaR